MKSMGSQRHSHTPEMVDRVREKRGEHGLYSDGLLLTAADRDDTQLEIMAKFAKITSNHIVSA